MNARNKLNRIDFRILGTCMVCKSEFNESNAEIFNEDDLNLYFHIDCPKCQSSSIVAISNIFSPHVTSFGILTDLTKRDLKKIDKIEKLTSDDVISYHSYVKIKSNNN